MWSFNSCSEIPKISCSQAEVKGQVRLSHLLTEHGIELLIHGHGEDVLPQTHTTCRDEKVSRERTCELAG